MIKHNVLEAIVNILTEVRGHFILDGENGQEYVIIAKNKFDELTYAAAERQLDLLSAVRSDERTSGSADEVLERINRDIALYELQRQEEELEERVAQLSVEGRNNNLEAKDEAGRIDDLALGGKRVRFEPLRGDLPPDLQE